jgi:hypothetical protein
MGPKWFRMVIRRRPAAKIVTRMFAGVFPLLQESRPI